MGRADFAGPGVKKETVIMPSPITNIIVVMLENRSYDNILGWLYGSGNVAPYNQAPSGQTGLNGLAGSESNPGCTSGSSPITVSASPSTAFPADDPGESFSDMAQQVFGPSAPWGNPYASKPIMPAMTMQGFTANYAATNPGVDCGDCMTYFTPAQVPVSAFLANNFAVCDQWFASVPCQTFTNRMFAVCGAPAISRTAFTDDPFSLVNDLQYLLANSVKVTPPAAEYVNLPSVFQALDVAYRPAAPPGPPNWKLYFFDYSIAAIIVPYVYQAAIGAGNVNVATYDNSDWPVGTVPHPAIIGSPLGAVPSTFLDDLAHRTLPKLSFIEPRYATDVALSSLPPNSNHPGDSSLLPPVLPGSKNPIDVANGETFLAEIYNALRNSSYWSSSLLIVTYDEHGGMYDHVPPVPATPPGAATTPGGGTPPITVPPAHDDADFTADAFGFNYLGCRVPAIIVSPYIAPGTTIPPSGNTPFDHTSIIRTVWDIFGLPTTQSLTQRDANAPSLSTYLTSSASNNTGPYPGSFSAAGPKTGASLPGNVSPRTPEQAQALFKARLTKSARGGTPAT
jgi:phospholipase C